MLKIFSMRFNLTFVFTTWKGTFVMRAIIAFALLAMFLFPKAIRADHPLFVEVKGACFRPFDPILRKIYSPHMANYQVEATYPISETKQIWNQFNVWGAVNYIFAVEGDSLWLREDSKMRIVPLTLGVKWIWPHIGVPKENDLQLYVGLGMRYFFVRIDNETDYAIEKVTFNGMGGVLEAGGLLYITSRVFLDFFLDGSYRRFYSSSKDGHPVKRHSLQVGGFSAGGGIGFKF